MSEPNSALTRERPDLWTRGLALASGLTGYLYLPKVPLADGTIYACGAGGEWTPPREKTPEEQTEDEINTIKKEISWRERLISQRKEEIEKYQKIIEDLEREIAEYRKKLTKIDPSIVFIPEGAMEWLLHEVGHWVAATPVERSLPNYGYGQEEKGVGKAREWQAWGFEEIVLGPYGHSRNFIPPTQRGGVAFAKNEPIPGDALRHAEQNAQADSIDMAEWQALYGEWIAYELGRHTPSWERYT